ncbi:MAG: 30S ribosome-binding factor RbfA [Flavobacteriales bacterium]
MESTRQKKVARLIQKEIAELFTLMGNGLNPGGMITVTTVRVSPDLSFAKVYLSVFKGLKAEQVIRNVEHASKEIRLKLGNKVRHQLRIVPELAFYLDDSLDYFERIDELLK